MNDDRFVPKYSWTREDAEKCAELLRDLSNAPGIGTIAWKMLEMADSIDRAILGPDGYLARYPNDAS